MHNDFLNGRGREEECLNSKYLYFHISHHISQHLYFYTQPAEIWKGGSQYWVVISISAGLLNTVPETSTCPWQSSCCPTKLFKNFKSLLMFLTKVLHIIIREKQGLSFIEKINAKAQNSCTSSKNSDFYPRHSQPGAPSLRGRGIISPIGGYSDPSQFPPQRPD